ncbi:hypothetical protein GALL_153370 [mine drainage metagenome]|uniref:Uncharacterized protein n=1 Tax=mine drainage metagenome TaxID=410659 RepID=A0A1J5S2Z1_9ZZZZ
MNARFPAVQTEAFPLQGGLDLVSPALSLAPGNLIDSVNFEPDINGGYRRMYGFERLDGRTAPSAATYSNIACAVTGTVATGNTVTGATSGATAVVLQVNGTTELIVTKVTDTFQAGEALQVSSVTQANLTSIAQSAALTPILHATYLGLAADNYRADIQKVPGSGPVRGTWYYDSNIYAFRDNAGATACVMYKATTSGWSAVSLGTEIQFASATGQINEGDTITGGTSGATAVVRRALLRTGTWTASGVGSLVIDTVVGVFQNGEALKVGATSMATSSSAATAISLLPGGRYEFLNTNFSGTLSTFRMYGCDGVNPLFEFDGTYYVPIRTGIGTDAPKFLVEWKRMLVAAVYASVVVSGIGAPYSWTALTGAAELATGDEVSGLLPQIGNYYMGSLAIYTAGNTNKTYILYGNTSADFKLVLQSPDSGAQPYTVQNIGFGYGLDTKGVVNIQTTLNFGNFIMSTLTRKIQPIINAKRGLAKASCIVRATNQYRVFFSDGTGIIVYMNGSELGAIMYFDLGSSRYMNQVCSIVDSTGIERVLAAGSDGYVYEMERGTSFDGGNIQAHLLTAFNSSKSPRTVKSYVRGIIEATAQNTAQISVGYDFTYGSSDTQPGASQSLTGVGGGGYWDQFTWDSFNWDAPYLNEYEIDISGDGRNISLLIVGDTNIDQPYTIHAAILHFVVRRLAR